MRSICNRSLTVAAPYPKLRLLALGVLWGLSAHAAVYNATPADYVKLMAGLHAGDTLKLAAGTYPRLSTNGLHGTASAWITITGPVSGPPAVILGSSCCNTIEISNSNYLAIKNLRIDSAGLAAVNGLSAKDGAANLTHHILIERNTFVGNGANQETVAISTKTATWGWIIRGNVIDGAGTGMYLGNSDGRLPFIGGLIENNLIMNTTGYNVQIKHQLKRPEVPGIPRGQSVTIIRHNVLIRDDRPSPNGNRPNLLVGGFPASGAGSTDWYEIYGNFFYHNPHEALLQCAGRVRVHDNILVDGGYAAMRFQDHEHLPLQVAHVYNNTVYSRQSGISFGSRAAVESIVTGNLVFAATPLAGPVTTAVNNIVDTVANAVLYVTAPSFTLDRMNFFPKTGKATGLALDLSKFTDNLDYVKDFNGIAKRPFIFRGAYAGQGTNPGWQLAAAIKTLL